MAILICLNIALNENYVKRIEIKINSAPFDLIMFCQDSKTQQIKSRLLKDGIDWRGNELRMFEVMTQRVLMNLWPR